MPKVIDGERLAFTGAELIEAARFLYWRGFHDAVGPGFSDSAKEWLAQPGYLKHMMIQAGLLLAETAEQAAAQAEAAEARGDE